MPCERLDRVVHICQAIHAPYFRCRRKRTKKKIRFNLISKPHNRMKFKYCMMFTWIFPLGIGRSSYSDIVNENWCSRSSNRSCLCDLTVYQMHQSRPCPRLCLSLIYSIVKCRRKINSGNMRKKILCKWPTI